MKHVHACLSDSKDGESSFHYCGSPVKLVQACLWAGNTLQRHLNRRRGAAKHLQASLSARNVRESSIHHCGGPVNLVQACLCVRNTLQRRFNRRGGAVKQASSSASKYGESTFTTVEVL